MAIVALIVGGIFLGQSLIRSAQVQGGIGEITKYTQAIGEFRDKYGALPGDFSAAATLWGTDAGCPDSPYNPNPHKATCNGTGDGKIIDPIDPTTFYEGFRAWQHMANAGLIEGSYTGTDGPAGGGVDPVLGINVPRSKVEEGGFFIGYFWNPVGNAEYYPHSTGYKHNFDYGSGVVSGQMTGPLFTPSEALQIDRKVDDGRPGTGTIVVRRPAFQPNCASDADSSVAVYQIATTTASCSLIIITGF